MSEICWVHLTGLGVVLIPSMITDIKNRMIPFVYLMVCLIVAGLVNYYVMKMNFFQMFSGGVFGLAFCGIAAMSHGNVGYGDGILITVIGVWCGFFITLFMTLTALISAVVVGLTLVIARRNSIKMEIPLAPFFSVPWMALIILRIFSEVKNGCGIH